MTAKRIKIMVKMGSCLYIFWSWAAALTLIETVQRWQRIKVSRGYGSVTAHITIEN